MERLIEVKAPVEQVFDLFSDPMNLPEWVSEGGEVQVIDERRFRWLMKQTNSSGAWEVSVQAFEPPAHLLWQATPNVRDSQGENGFTVEAYFEETKRNTTILRLVYSETGLSHETLATAGGGAAPINGALADNLPPAMMARELEQGLEYFKGFVEHSPVPYESYSQATSWGCRC